MRIIKTILFVVSVILSPIIYAQNSPIPMLEQTANNIIATLKENKSSLKSNPNIIYQAVETNLLPIVDVAGMSRSVLGRQAWSKATEKQKINFPKRLRVWSFVPIQVLWRNTRMKAFNFYR